MHDYYIKFVKMAADLEVIYRHGGSTSLSSSRGFGGGRQGGLPNMFPLFQHAIKIIPIRKEQMRFPFFSLPLLSLSLKTQNQHESTNEKSDMNVFIEAPKRRCKEYGSFYLGSAIYRQVNDFV